MPTSLNLPLLCPFFLLAAWILMYWLIEYSPWRRLTLTHQMNRERVHWMNVMSKRTPRIVDTSIIIGLQNGSAFFASTALVGTGSAFSLIGVSDKFAAISDSFSLIEYNDVFSFEIKTIILILIFVYTFFKFATAYRLFNYTAILLGSVPDPQDSDTPLFEKQLKKTTDMSILAGLEFNRGQRAFYTGIAYLGWYFNTFIFFCTMSTVYAIMIHWQFFSTVRSTITTPEKN